MKKAVMFLVALLAMAVPGFCQTDVDGNKVNTEVRMTFDGSSYSDGRSSSLGTLDVTHRLTQSFAIEGVVNGGQYFGSRVAGGGGYVTYNPTANSYITVGGLRNSSTQTTSVWTVSAEGGIVVHKSNGFFRATEVDYNQTWKGFSILPATTVTMYTPRVIFYFPKGFDFMLHAGLVDLATPTGTTRSPSGGARVRIPIGRRLQFTASAGFDAEGITNVQQLQAMSTRNYGGGVKFWINRTTSIEALGTNSLYTVNHLNGKTYAFTLAKRF